MTAEAIEHWADAADPRRRIGHAVEFAAVIDSTNDRARALLAVPGGEGVAVVADHQRSGRGRRGRRWESPAGRNLMLSVGLRTNVPAADAWLVSAAASLAVRAAVAPIVDLGVKWPNDVVTPDGRKVAGILVETVLEGATMVEAVIGIGVNVNWRHDDMPPEIAARATSLAEIVGRPVPRVSLLARLLALLDDELAPRRFGDSTRERYGAASVLTGRSVVVDRGDRLVRGVAAGIDLDGSLLLDMMGERVAIGHGEVVRVGSDVSGGTV